MTRHGTKDGRRPRKTVSRLRRRFSRRDGETPSPMGCVIAAAGAIGLGATGCLIMTAMYAYSHSQMVPSTAVVVERGIAKEGRMHGGAPEYHPYLDCRVPDGQVVRVNANDDPPVEYEREAQAGLERTGIEVGATVDVHYVPGYTGVDTINDEDAGAVLSARRVPSGHLAWLLVVLTVLGPGGVLLLVLYVRHVWAKEDDLALASTDRHAEPADDSHR